MIHVQTAIRGWVDRFKRLGGRRPKVGWRSARFGERVLAFDAAASRFFALLMARAKAAGHTIGFADGQIAAIAGVNGFAVAARDVGPFVAAGVAVINPWEQG